MSDAAGGTEADPVFLANAYQPAGAVCTHSQSHLHTYTQKKTLIILVRGLHIQG